MNGILSIHKLMCNFSNSNINERLYYHMNTLIYCKNYGLLCINAIEEIKYDIPFFEMNA